MLTTQLWPFFGFGGGVTPAPQYDPVWLRCLEAAHAAIVGLNLEGIEPTSIIALESPLADYYFGKNDQGEMQLPYPGIIVWPFDREAVDENEYSNIRDSIRYPIAVSFIDKGAGSMVRGTDAPSVAARRARLRFHMLWREEISRRFSRAQWIDIFEIEQSTVRPNAYMIPEVYRNRDLFHGCYVIDFHSLEAWDHGDE